MNATWSADPWGRFPYRWFDGTTWTALVFDGATQYLDPYVTQVMINPVAAGLPVGGPVPGQPHSGSAGAPTTTATFPGGVPMPAYVAVAPPAPHPYAPPAPAPVPTHVPTAAMPAPTAPPPCGPAQAGAGPAGATRTTAAEAPAAHVTPPGGGTPRPGSTQNAAASAATSDATSASTGASADPGATRDAGPRPTNVKRSASADAGKRPWWVPVVGSIAVVGLAWWLFNLRGGDDRPTQAVADQGATDTTAAETTTTVVEVTLPPVTAPVATTPVAPVPDATAAPVVGPDPALVQDCVDFVPTAAYIGDAGATDLWNASGFDVEVLRSLCAALPAWRLGAISEQRDALDLAFTGSTAAPSPTTTIVATPVPSDPGVVPVSPTMPPPLPTTVP